MLMIAAAVDCRTVHTLGLRCTNLSRKAVRVRSLSGSPSYVTYVQDYI